MPGAGDPRRRRVAREVVRSRLVERIAGSASSGRSPRALPAPEWHANGREFHATCQGGRDAHTSTPRPHGRPPHYRSLRLGAQSGVRKGGVHSPNTRRRTAARRPPGFTRSAPPPRNLVEPGRQDYCGVSSIGTTRKPPAAHVAGGGCRRSCRRRSFAVARSVVRRWPVRRSQITATWSRTIPRRLS